MSTRDGMGPEEITEAEAIQDEAEAMSGTGERDHCRDCDEAAKHAYSDATTPGFFSPKCKKHQQHDFASDGAEQGGGKWFTMSTLPD